MCSINTVFILTPFGHSASGQSCSSLRRLKSPMRWERDEYSQAAVRENSGSHVEVLSLVEW